MTERELWAENRQFGLKISNPLIEKVLETCRHSIPNETGGVIVGFYNDDLDCATVTAFTTPTEDSQAGKNWFYRGTKGLQSQLNRLWFKQKRYYLGEWHFHPYSLPDPSSQDIRQMYNIAADSAYSCPEAILLILGGNPSGNWTMQGYVFRQLEKVVYLKPD